MTSLRLPSTPISLPLSPFLSSRCRLPSLISLLPPRRIRSPSLRSRFAPVASFNPDIFKVVQTTWKVAKRGVEAGANLVPDSIPRPIARIIVTGIAAAVGLFLLKSFLSTLFFTVAVMGLIYFTFISFNTEEAPRPRGDGDSTDEDALEEARRIMDKYK